MLKIFLFAGFTSMLDAVTTARTARLLTGAIWAETGTETGVDALQWFATENGLEIAYFGNLALVSKTDGKVRAYLAIGSHADMTDWLGTHEFRINPVTGAAEVINRTAILEAIAA